MKPIPSLGNSRIEYVHNFHKQTLIKFLKSSDLEWDNLLPFACYWYNIYPSSNGKESPFFLMFGYNPAEGQLAPSITAAYIMETIKEKYYWKNSMSYGYII